MLLWRGSPQCAASQANTCVRKYGLRLLPDLREGVNPMPYKAAQDREVAVCIDLRAARFGVWQA